MTASSQPSHVACRVPSPWLFERADGRLQAMQPGAVAPWHAGPGLLLVAHPVADVLRSAGVPEIEFEQAVIVDPRTGREDRSRVRVRVRRTFAAQELGALPLEGHGLFAMGEHVFCTPALRALLAACFDFLEFSPGLSEFG